jgi:isoprenylcysteine carboxyl methyltransferase (ICMT) family protein YpbQ
LPEFSIKTFNPRKHAVQTFGQLPDLIVAPHEGTRLQRFPFRRVHHPNHFFDGLADALQEKHVNHQD